MVGFAVFGEKREGGESWSTEDKLIGCRDTIWGRRCPKTSLGTIQRHITSIWEKYHINLIFYDRILLCFQINDSIPAF